MKTNLMKRLDRLEDRKQRVLVQDLRKLSDAEAEAQVIKWQRVGLFNDATDLLVRIRRFA